MREIRTVTDRIVRQLYGNGSTTTRKDVLAGVRAGNKLTSPRARIFWPVLMENMPSDYLSSNKPTFEEKAEYCAVRLYAIHQQGKSTCVYENKNGEADTFFGSLQKLRGRLKQEKGDSKSLDRRIQALLSMSNFDSIVNSLVQLEKIGKANGFDKIDYSQLAQDLLVLQYSYESANSIRLKWGREYFNQK